MTRIARRNLLVPPMTGDSITSTEMPARAAAFVRAWVICWCVGLLGYAVMGRGFAYIGVAPVFFAEFLLLGGCLCLLVCGRWWPILRMPQTILLIILCVWCVLRTLPYVRTYGIDALRDSIIYVYSLFAFAVAGVIITRPQLLTTIVNRYRLFTKIFPSSRLSSGSRSSSWGNACSAGRGPRWPSST
jgi:hypothetical protein